MPFMPTDKADGTTAPSQPHLAMFTEDGWVAIPEGAKVWLIEDAKVPTKIFPMLLLKVRHDKLVFGLVDANGGRTEFTYKLVSGKPLNKQAMERMLQNRRG